MTTQGARIRKYSTTVYVYKINSKTVNWYCKITVVVILHKRIRLNKYISLTYIKIFFFKNYIR